VLRGPEEYRVKFVTLPTLRHLSPPQPRQIMLWVAGN